MLATVKGDVHDIGKNIVGVVLGCNNYEILDLGVMVAADTILDTAAEIGADAVGLSGLITPSLDEMVNVAREMERRGLELPLLIGGATTSKQHTAVRIAPAYSQPTLHVRDASRVVGVVSDLLDPVRRAALDQENRADQDRLRDLHAERRSASRCFRTRTRSTTGTAWPTTTCPSRDSSEPALVEPDLETLREYIDWQFFFHAWDLKGKFPAILERPEARELYDDALELLDELVRERLLQARGVLRLLAGFVRRRGRRRGRRDVVRHAQAAGRPRRLAPEPLACRLRRACRRGDHVGAFTVGVFGADELAGRFEAEQDDYRAILTKALADRLAEAFAEYLHEESRRSWYEQGPRRSNDELVAERYRGIRPAFGYPACPDHSREGEAVRAPRRGGARLRAHRDVRDLSRGRGVRDLPPSPGGAVLLGRPDRPRPGRRLRCPPGPSPAERALSEAEPRLRARSGLSREERFYRPRRTNAAGM